MICQKRREEDILETEFCDNRGPGAEEDVKMPGNAEEVQTIQMVPPLQAGTGQEASSGHEEKKDMAKKHRNISRICGAIGAFFVAGGIAAIISARNIVTTINGQLVSISTAGFIALGFILMAVAMIFFIAMLMVANTTIKRSDDE